MKRGKGMGAVIDRKLLVERLWTIEQLSEALGVPKSWIYDQTRRRFIPHWKIAGKLRFDPVDIDAWIRMQPGCSLTTRGSVLQQRRD